jgi:hypothetical protein
MSKSKKIIDKLDKYLEEIQRDEKSVDEIEDLVENMSFDLDETSFDQAGFDKIEEGQWRPSGNADWWYRINPPKPEMKVPRNIHLSRKKYIKSRNKHVSWYDDGSRHHPQRFPAKVDKAAKTLARQLLKLPDDVILENFCLFFRSEDDDAK